MSDMKKLLEAMDSMSKSEKKSTGPEFPGYLKGTDPASKVRDKMVGGAQESVIKELAKTAKDTSTERKLKEEFANFQEGDVVAFPKKHKGDLASVNDCPKCGGDLQGGKYMGHEVKVCMPCKQVYLPPNSGIDQQGNPIKESGVAEGSLNEFAPVSGPGGDNYEDDLHDILMTYIMRNEPGLINHFGKDEVDGVVANMVTMGTFASIDPNNKEDLADALDKIIDILNDDLPDPQGVAEGSLEEDKGMTGYNAFKREWRTKHGADAKVPAYDSKEYTSYVYRQNDKKQGVAENFDAQAAASKEAEIGRLKAQLKNPNNSFDDHYKITRQIQKLIGMHTDDSVLGKDVAEESTAPTKYRATVEYGPTASDAHFVTVTASSTEEAEAKVQKWCEKKGVRNPMITINGADKPVDVAENSQAERKITRTQALIQDYYNRSRETSNDIKRDHYIDMARQLEYELEGMINDAEQELNEKSVSKAQFRTMAAAAKNPKFAKKVGISSKVAKEFHKADKKANYKSLPAKVDEDGQPDAITMDVPLMIRLFEYAREDAKTDMDLHDVAERLITLSQEGRTLTMQDYDTICPSQEQDLDEEQEAKYGDKYQDAVKRVGQKAREQEKRKPVDIQALAAKLAAMNKQVKELKEVAAITPTGPTTAGGAPATQQGQATDQEAQDLVNTQKNLAKLKTVNPQLNPGLAGQALQNIATNPQAPVAGAQMAQTKNLADLVGDALADPQKGPQVATMLSQVQQAQKLKK